MQAATLSPGPDMARALMQHLDRFLSRLPAGVGDSRREANRVAIPLLLRIEAINGSFVTAESEFITGVGKDLSRSGIGFFHREPLPQRHVILSFDDPRLEQLSIEVELNRCRFSNLGWYESGGRLLRLVEPQQAA